jgi:hypothetical protein
MHTETANQFFETVDTDTIQRYTDYWESVRPVTYGDFMRRYLFAFASVHTTWQGNVRGYEAVKDLSWVDDKESLRTKLINAKCGMHNNRTEYMWKFKNQFFENPELFCVAKKDWTAYRNEIVTQLSGLGIAKVSFALEMCFPKEAEVSCIDTWGIKLYNLEDKANFQTKKGIGVYELAEKHWVEKSLGVNAPSMVTRSIYWDRLKKEESPRYWSYVLEDKQEIFLLEGN